MKGAEMLPNCDGLRRERTVSTGPVVQASSPATAAASSPGGSGGRMCVRSRSVPLPDLEVLHRRINSPDRECHGSSLSAPAFHTCRRARTPGGSRQGCLHYGAVSSICRESRPSGPSVHASRPLPSTRAAGRGRPGGSRQGCLHYGAVSSICRESRPSGPSVHASRPLPSTRAAGRGRPGGSRQGCLHYGGSSGTSDRTSASFVTGSSRRSITMASRPRAVRAVSSKTRIERSQGHSVSGVM
jgi:hypothetical protein